MSPGVGTTNPLRVDVVGDEHLAALDVAHEVARLVEARRPGDSMVLGCPAGRTPRRVYAVLGLLAHTHQLNLSGLEIVMMDEYVERVDIGFTHCSAEVSHSCRRFAEHELRQVLNAHLPRARQVRVEAVHTPDPGNVDAFEALLSDLGGIDLFLLAAGTSDGHVAFNSPGSSLDSMTRVVELAETTRRDNLATFPSFDSLDEVPRYGVTVGLGTIVDHAARVTLLLPGAEKAAAFERTVHAVDFDPTWPATVVHRCRHPRVVADRAAVHRSDIDLRES